MIINTSRLIIKPIDEKSLKNILKYVVDISLDIPLPKSASPYQIKKFLLFNEKIKKFNSLGYFVIILKENYKVIGLLSIIPKYLKENLINELGYSIIKDYRNRGFATEVIFNLLNCIFTKTNIKIIYSLIKKNNCISKHIIESKLEFNFENEILDTNVLKYVYSLEKSKFISKIKFHNIH